MRDFFLPKSCDVSGGKAILTQGNWRLMLKNNVGIRQFGYYFCGWWCFLTNQRFCNTPRRKKMSNGS